MASLTMEVQSQAFVRSSGRRAACLLVALALLASGSLLRPNPIGIRRPNATLSETPDVGRLAQWLREGRYTLVLLGGSQLLKESPDAKTHRFLGAAHASMGSFDAAEIALQRAAQAGEPVAYFRETTRALRLRAAGDRAGAMAAGRAAIEIDSDHPQAHLILGLCSLEGGQVEKAAQRLRAALNLEPEFAYARTLLGSCEIKQGNLLEGILTLEAAVASDPADSRGRYGLALAYSAVGLHRAASHELEIAADSETAFPDLRERLAFAWLQSGEPAKAATAAAAALLQSPGNERLRLLHGRALLLENRWREAEPELRAAAASPQTRGSALYHLALGQLLANQLGTAHKTFLAAADADPSLTNAHTAAAIIDHLQGRTAAAETRLAAMLKAPRADPINAFHLGNLHLARNDWPAAQATLQRAGAFSLGAEEMDLKTRFAGQNPQSAAHVGLATFLLIEGFLEAGSQACDAALEADAKHPFALRLKGRALVRQGRFKEAENVFRRLESQDPQAMSTLLELADARAKNGDYPGAVEAFRRIVQIHPQHVGAYERLGAMEALAGRAEDAEKSFRKMIALAPKSPAGYNAVAYFLADINRELDEALQLAQRAIEFAPKNPGVLDTLGWVHFRRGEWDQAVASLSQAEKLGPHVPTIRYHLALAHHKRGESALAARRLTAALRLNPGFPEAAEARALLESLQRPKAKATAK